METSLSTKWLVIVLVLVLVGPVSAIRGEDEPKSASDAKDDKKPKTAETVKLNGVFESINAEEITSDAEHLSGLKLKRILPHGTAVKKNQNVIWFETEELDKQLKKAETEFRLAKLSMEDEEFSYKQFLETQKLDRAAADRKRKQAQQAFDNFVQVDRERQIKSAEQSLKSSRASLENAQEELKQLTQMYEEDDLTEESEEIVLKRAKRSVEFAEYRLEGTEISTERTIKQSVPRSDLEQQETLDRAKLAHEKSMRDLESARKKRDIEIGKKRDEFKEKEADLNELRDERKQIVLRSPIDGIVLHGKLNRGKLSDKPSQLKNGSAISKDQVIATVVSSNRLQVRVELTEKQIGQINEGMHCKIKPTAFPKRELNGVVKSISTVAYAGTKFDCVVAIRGKPNRVLPTMTCELEFAQDAKEETQDE